MLRRWFEAIRREEDGQDLIEYTLLMAFLALVSVGLFMNVGGNTASVWSGADTTITQAASVGSGAATAPDPSPPGDDTPPSGGGDGRHHDHH